MDEIYQRYFLVRDGKLVYIDGRPRAWASYHDACQCAVELDASVAIVTVASPEPLGVREVMALLTPNTTWLD